MLEKIDLKEFIKTYELPETTKFIGYSIHLTESDEFLYKYKVGNVVITKAWCQSPEMAKKFYSLKKANRVKLEIAKPDATVVWLFDIGKQIIATVPDTEKV